MPTATTSMLHAYYTTQMTPHANGEKDQRLGDAKQGILSHWITNDLKQFTELDPKRIYVCLRFHTKIEKKVGWSEIYGRTGVRKPWRDILVTTYNLLVIA